MPPKTPDEYRAEMMRLYSRASQPPPDPEPKPDPTPEPSPQPDPIPPETPISPPTPPLPDNAFPFVETPPDAEPTVPLPIVSEPVPEPEPAYTPEKQPDVSSYGWLKVITRTADEAMPLPNVSVRILQQTGTEMHLLYALLTDESGETLKVKLPAPPRNHERMQPYSTYLVRVFLKGYARMESDQIPIFAGITSLQPFAMFPLPYGVGDTQPAIIYRNTEPMF